MSTYEKALEDDGIGIEVEMESIEDAGQRGGKATAEHIKLGRQGELAARRFLEFAGFEIIETNWRCIAGEVDIIARDECSLHFVEVKTRRGSGRGFPVEAVTPEKRRRYERIAELYLREANPCDCSVHFDIISLLALDETRAFLKVYSNAFACDR